MMKFVLSFLMVFSVVLNASAFEYLDKDTYEMATKMMGGAQKANKFLNKVEEDVRPILREYVIFALSDATNNLTPEQAYKYHMKSLMQVKKIIDGYRPESKEHLKYMLDLNRVAGLFKDLDFEYRFFTDDFSKEEKRVINKLYPDEESLLDKFAFTQAISEEGDRLDEVSPITDDQLRNYMAFIVKIRQGFLEFKSRKNVIYK